MVGSALPQGIMSALQNSSTCDIHVISTTLKARRRENQWNDEAERQLQNAHGRACQMCQVQIVSQDSQWTEMEKRGVCLHLMRMVSDSEILSNRSVMSAAAAILNISEELQKGERKEEWMHELQHGLEQLVHNPGLIQPARRKVSSALMNLKSFLQKNENEFQHAAFKKGVIINSTSDLLTLNSQLQLKSVIADLAEEEAERDSRNVTQGNEPSNRDAGESDSPQQHLYSSQNDGPRSTVEHRGESAQQKSHYDKVNRQQSNPYHRGHGQDYPREEENYSRGNSSPIHGRRANRSYSFSSYDEPRSEKRQRHSRDNEQPRRGEHKQEHYYRKEVDGVSADVVPEESRITMLPPVEPKEATNKYKTFVRVLDVDCNDLRDRVICACDRIGSYKFVGWCQSRHLLDVVFENNREAAAALIDIEALGLYSTKRNPNMQCKVFLKSSDFEGGPYTGGVQAPSRNITDNGSRERRSYPPKQLPQWSQDNDNQNKSPENLGMNWGGSSSKQQHARNGGGNRRFSPTRSRSRSLSWSRSRSPPGHRRDYGGSRRDFPRGSRPRHNVGRGVHYEGGGGRRRDVRPDSRRSFERFNESRSPHVARSKHSHSNSPGQKPESGYSARGSTVPSAARERHSETHYHQGSNPHRHSGGSPPYSSSSRGQGAHSWQGGSRWEERTGRSSNPEWRRGGGGPWRGGRGSGDRGFNGGRWRGGRGRGYGSGGGRDVDFYNAKKTSEYNQLEVGLGQQNEEQNSAAHVQLESGVEQQQQSPEDLGWGLQYVDSSTGREGGDNDNQNVMDTPDGGMVVMEHDDAIVEEEGGE